MGALSVHIVHVCAGEACSHIAAILFAVEFITTARDTTSCTDVRSLWNVPTLEQIRCEPLKSMDFGCIIKTSEVDVSPIERTEIAGILGKIKEGGSTSVLMRVVEPFASEIALTVETAGLPNIFKEMYREEYEELYLEQLMQLSEQYVDISMSSSECEKVEEATRDQAESDEWWNHRTGRITASKLKQVCRTSRVQPSLSLIKQICYPIKFGFQTKAMKWGRPHEKTALEAYQLYSATSHEQLEIKNVGLVIVPELPQFGASPDAIVKCDCCGCGCVEVKCPYLLKEMTIEEFAKKKYCLKFEDGKISLSNTHAYYYQTQQQMA